MLDLDTVLGEVAEALDDLGKLDWCATPGSPGLGDSTAVREVVQSDLYETVQAYFNVLNPSAGFAGHSGGQQDFEGLIDTAACRLRA